MIVVIETNQLFCATDLLAFLAGLAACLIGSEACATAHHLARELIALGHQVRLEPPSYVKAYLRRKNDAADAEAICEAVSRPSTRFVPVKSEEQPSSQWTHHLLLPGFPAHRL